MKTICIDIDGTITHYIEWVDAQTFGDVLPHCAEAIHHLKADGWFVIIYSTRADKAQITRFLNEHNVPFDAINENPNQPANAVGGKPYADVYLDDRAIQFDGHWEDMYERISSFAPWEASGEPTTNPPLDYCKDFLIEDLSQSMETHRHYDTVNWDVTKFAFGEILIAIGACWTIFTIDNSIQETYKWLTMSIICAASWLFGMMSIYTIIKNRTYFVRTSRHINELRHKVIQRNPFGFSNMANYWSDPNKPKVKDWRSTQFISLYMLSILTASISSASILFLIKYNEATIVYPAIFAAIATLIIVLSLILCVAKESFE